MVMIMVMISPSDQISGFLSFIAIILTFIITILILPIYRKKNDKILLVFMLFIISINSPWYPSGFGYICWLITGNIFNYQTYIFLGTIGIPFVLLSWIYIYFSILYPNKIKSMRIILLIISILSIVFYVYVYYFLFFAPRAPIEVMLGEKRSALDVEYKGFVIIFILIVALITFSLFLHFSIRSILTKDDREIQWRGVFLLISSILSVIGTTSDAIFELTEIILIFTRIILMSTAIFFYFAFMMPEWLKKILKIT